MRNLIIVASFLLMQGCAFSDAVPDVQQENGHIIGDGGIVVSGAVSRYWVDTDINFTNVEVFSDLEVHLVFTDPTTHEPIYDARYSGHGSEKKGMVTERVMSEVLAASVASLVEEIVLDEDLVDAFRDYRQARR